MDRDSFIETYIDENAWREGKDPETCRENAKKYSVSLFGENVSRSGWFQFLADERGTEPEEATATDAKRFLRYLQEQGLSAPTRMQARSGISQWYRIMRPGEENPIEGMDASWSVTTDKESATGEERVYLSKEDVQALIENVPEPTLRGELLIKLLYETGCRRMEIGTLTVDNLDVDEREARVYGDKTDDWRTVTFSESLKTPLSVWLSGPRQDEPGWHEDNPYLFPSPTVRGDNDHISGQMIYETVTDAAADAGLQRSYGTDVNGQNQHAVTPHVLRHTHAVHAIKNGVSAPHLKEMLGHFSLSVTQLYADIAEDDAVDEMKKRGPSL